MKIHLVRTPDFRSSELSDVYSTLLDCPGILEFILEETAFLFDRDEFEWQQFFSKLKEYRSKQKIPDTEFIVVLTSLSNSANWFSCPNPSGNKEIFIHTTNWENYIHADSKFPIAYQVIANILHSHLIDFGDNGLDEVVHKEPVGCVNDLCQWKPDISFKLRTGDICSDCQLVYNEVLPEGFLDHSIEIFEYVRKGMIGTKPFIEPPKFVKGIPFPVAHTKRNLSMSNDPLTKLMQLIDHFDSIARALVIILGNVILSNEEFSGFWDEQSLNDHPSLGNWVSAIHKLSEYKRNDIGDFNLPNDLASRISYVHQLYTSKEIVNLRNNISHGYTTNEQEEYQSLYMNKLSVATEIEKAIFPVLRRIKYFQNISMTNRDGKLYLRCLEFSGSHPVFSRREIEVNADINSIPKSGKVYITSDDCQTWKTIEPYWIYRECPTCNHSRLLVSDGQKYLDPLIGHRVTL